MQPAAVATAAMAAGPADSKPSLNETPSTPLTNDKKMSEPAGQWPRLEARMRELGVTRFRVEGEPGGMMRFICILPMVEPAVGCQFEAEAEDFLTAAEMAVRRAGIWRATESLPGTMTAAQTR
jgi:hypothetical protein